MHGLAPSRGCAWARVVRLAELFRVWYSTVRQGIEMQMQIRYDVLICVVALMLWRADAAIAG